MKYKLLLLQITLKHKAFNDQCRCAISVFGHSGSDCVNCATLELACGHHVVDPGSDLDCHASSTHSESSWVIGSSTVMRRLSVCFVSYVVQSLEQSAVSSVAKDRPLTAALAFFCSCKMTFFFA